MRGLGRLLGLGFRVSGLGWQGVLRIVPNRELSRCQETKGPTFAAMLEVNVGLRKTFLWLVRNEGMDPYSSPQKPIVAVSIFLSIPSLSAN